MPTRRMRLMVLVLFACLIAPRVGAQTPPFAGVWAGAIAVEGTTLPMTVTFKEAAGAATAAIDIQGAKGLPLRAVTRVGPVVHFELPAGLGVARFDGVIDGAQMSGSFTQGPATGTFTLTRDEAASAVALAPVAPPPYKEEDVRFTNGEITLAGTLTIPPGAGPFPAVVMITGSGPQDRDEGILGFRPFQVIADHLSRRGIAVLRDDDRGVGGSSGSVVTATTADFAGDVLAAVAFLSTRPDIDAKRVSLVGHSEGASVAAIAASRSPAIASIVLMGGGAMRGDEILRRQATDLAKLAGATDADVAKILAAHKKVTEAVISGAPVSELTSALRALSILQIEAQPGVRSSIGDVNAFVDQRMPGVVAQMQSPWMKYFVSFDPSAYFAEVRVPILALWGGKDTQAPVDPNRPSLEAAVAKGRAPLTVKVYPDANHLFIKAVSGSPAEYPALDKVFIPGLLDDLTDWVGKIK